MISKEIIKAAKDHNVPPSWVDEVCNIYDVRERGLAFACYYSLAKCMEHIHNHEDCMKKARLYLESHNKDLL
tara:strand:+ start:29537 stop:29752 length:216 start_codon:yes stop_codon:yes gene_type:complete